MPLGETTQGKLFSCLQFEKLGIGCPRNCLVHSVHSLGSRSQKLILLTRHM